MADEATIDPVGASQVDITLQTQLTKPQIYEEWKNRQAMAYISLFSMIAVTVALFFINDSKKIEQLGVALTWFYGAMASIVAAFIGFRAWQGIKGK